MTVSLGAGQFARPNGEEMSAVTDASERIRLSKGLQALLLQHFVGHVGQDGQVEARQHLRLGAEHGDDC